MISSIINNKTVLLNFQERVAAALENSHLLEVVNQCLAED